MANILDHLEKIKSAVYGKDVRQSIVDAIHQCYDDGKAGAIDLQAREQIENMITYDESTKTLNICSGGGNG